MSRWCGQLQWRAAWSGIGAAIACATLGIVAVAICWLPVSGEGGKAHSAIDAGLLTFLASLHGGVTVDGTVATWLPLGMTVIVAVVAWRVGGWLGSVAEGDLRQRVQTFGIQALAFTIACVITVPIASLGTSRAPYLGVFFASFLLFGVAGGAAFVRSSGVSEELSRRLPRRTGTIVRGACAALLVYAAVGAVLVATSVVVHFGRVEKLAGEVGGGWGGVPILLLGILAAPNAVIAAAAYLAGPGFSVGTATTVSLTGGTHGVLPAFPLLGAVPQGAAPPVVWPLVVLAGLGAGAACTVVAVHGATDSLVERAKCVGGSVAVVFFAALILAWLGGGSIGSDELADIGAPPGWFALCVAAALIVSSSLSLAVASAWPTVRGSLGWVSGSSSGSAADSPVHRRAALPAQPSSAALAAETVEEQWGDTVFVVASLEDEDDARAG